MPNFSESLPVPYCNVTATCVSPNTYPSVKSVFPVREHISLGICVRGNTYHGETHIIVTSQILDNGRISICYQVTPFFWRPENFVEGFFFCFHLHCSDERISEWSESQIAGLIRIRPNERIFTTDLRPNTASYSSVLWNASKQFLWTDFISLHVYAYTFMNMYRSLSNGASISHTSPWSQPFPE